LARSDQIRDQSINMTRQNQETLDYMLQSNRERSQARMDSRERVNQGAIDAIKNENVYRDSSGGTFRDTDKYKDIWTNPVNNERIYTDDSTYNPNADKRVNDVPWEQAQPVR
ncbi:MAG: hypothetical protein LBP68_01195, partial [Acidobacteriota bacterium]|nr:hypothetical protein [Acidobacteriota bacterium]